MSAGFQVLLYYRYVEIADPEGFAAAQRALCEELGLRGRILVAREGINGTVSGTREATERYMEAARCSDELGAMEFKIDPAGGHAFPKLSVKVRPELVTLGLGAGEDIDPGALTGERLSASEFRRAMREEGVVLLDGRNNYESAAGRFEGAVCPDVEHFRDFPQWIRENLADAKGKKVLTYCTGGIRCEKLSGLLIQEGFSDVAQLDGGIVNYGKDEGVRGEGFEGKCYVFDERVLVPVNRTEGASVVATCLRCGEPDDRYVNCRYTRCNAQIFLCGDCEAQHGRYCGETCRERAEVEGAQRDA